MCMYCVYICICKNVCMYKYMCVSVEKFTERDNRSVSAWSRLSLEG